MASFTPQQVKKNNKECRGSIANLNLQFNNDFGTVKLSIGNYHEENISNMIYLLRIDINEENRGQHKCKPLLMQALKEGKTRLLNSSFKTEGKRIHGLVHIDTKPQYLKRARKCYIDSYRSIGLNIFLEEKEGTKIYFRSDEVIPESGASGAVMSRKPGKKRNRRKDGKKPRQFTFTSPSTSSPSTSSPSTSSPSSASSSGLGSFSPDDLLVQRMGSLLSPSGSPDRRRRKPSKPSPGQRMFQQALSSPSNKKGGRKSLFRKSLFKKKRTKKRKRGYVGKSPKRTKKRKRGYVGKSPKSRTKKRGRKSRKKR
jgi:hypothetical protein